MKKIDLPQKTQEFLAAFKQPSLSEQCHAAPLYFRTDTDTAEYIEDVAIYINDIRTFEFKNNALKNGIYYGGAVVFVKTCYGTLVVPDERDGWFKPAAAGIAEAAEHKNLSTTAERELLEELFVFRLDQTTRYVPIGAKEKVNRISSLGFSVKQLVEVGALTAKEHFFNDRVGSYEMVFTWDISELKDFSVISHEEWFRSGHSGIVVYAMKKGKIVGNFSGQQGFIPFKDYGFHPTVQHILR